MSLAIGTTEGLGSSDADLSISDAEDVITAARARAAAMSERDDGRLRELLHPCFTWTSHQGERFDLDSYLQSNQHGVNTWVDQEAP